MSPSFKRSVLARLSVALVAVGSMAALSATPASADAFEDGTTFNLINQARDRAGVCPLTLHQGIDLMAKGWVSAQANAGAISHNVVAMTNQNISGENVGYGLNIFEVNNMFLNSPTHFANMINKNFTSVGVGVTHVGDRTYVTYDFLAGTPSC